MEVNTVSNLIERKSFRFGVIIVFADIIGFIIYGTVQFYQSFITDLLRIATYTINKGDIYVNGYLSYSIANSIFTIVAIIGYIVLGILLLKRKKVFKKIFTLIQSSTVLLYCFKYVLLINSTVYVVTSGAMKHAAFSDYKFLIGELTRNTKYMYSSVFLIVMSIALIIYIWKTKYFETYKGD
jgi:hypothetical protein